MKKIVYKTNQNNPVVRAYKEAVERGKKNQHVVPYNGEWAVRGAGNNRVTSVHQTQGAAIEAARDIAINRKSEVIIHRSDGTIRDRDSYGNDPFPPRDKRQ